MVTLIEVRLQVISVELELLVIVAVGEALLTVIAIVASSEHPLAPVAVKYT